MNYFVTAIGTDSGKTLVSALLTEALGFDYWKPVQAGAPTDSDTIAGLISEAETRIHQEAYYLQKPASPHDGAAEEGTRLSLEHIKASLPQTDKGLIIEGAGGLMVPLNEQDVVADIATLFPCRVILVSNLYLGSINHTLLSLMALRNMGLDLAGIVFNGPANAASQEIIMQKAGVPLLFHLPHYEQVDRALVSEMAPGIAQQMNQYL